MGVEGVVSVSVSGSDREVWTGVVHRACDKKNDVYGLHTQKIHIQIHT